MEREDYVATTTPGGKLPPIHGGKHGDILLDLLLVLWQMPRSHRGRERATRGMRRLC